MLEEKPDKELREMIMAEIEDAEAGIERTTRELKILVMPKDPNDDKNVIIEIRGGAGGEEAALFSAVLYRMFTRYAERKTGLMKLLMQTKQNLAVSRKLCFQLKAKERTAG